MGKTNTGLKHIKLACFNTAQSLYATQTMKSTNKY